MFLLDIISADPVENARVHWPAVGGGPERSNLAAQHHHKLSRGW